MNRIPILAGGAVLAAVVLCGGAVTVANALTSTPVSQVLTIAGVSTTPTATPSVRADPTAIPTPSTSATAEPGDDNGVDGTGVTVVAPSDPTKIDGRGCAHLGKHGGDDPASHDATDDNDGTRGSDHDGDDSGHHVTGTPVPQDPDHSGSGDRRGDSGGFSGGGSGDRDGSGGGHR